MKEKMILLDDKMNIVSIENATNFIYEIFDVDGNIIERTTGTIEQ